MKATNINLIDNYFEFLDKLSPDIKLEIISRLSQSLKDKKESKEKPLQELFGAFISEKSAEELIEEIRQSRNFTRQIEEL